MRKKMYIVEEKIKHSIKLYKEDLYTLEELLISQVSLCERIEDLEVSAHFKDRVLYKNSVEEIFAESHSESTDHFTLRIIGWNNDRQIDKRIEIVIYGLLKTISIKGDNQVWVMGIKEVLNKFFSDKKTFYSDIRRISPFIGGTLAGICLITMQLSFEEGNYITGILSFLTAAIAVGLSFALSLNKILPHSRIYLYSKSNTKVNYQTINAYIGTLVGFLTLIATIIIAYLTLK